MRRPMLLDLFCGDGGCSVGYHRAGFDVVGVDTARCRNYPFQHIRADAFAVLGDVAFLRLFDVIAASPPCKAYTPLAALHKIGHVGAIPVVRDGLVAAGRPYVLENVAGARAELRNPVTLCGSMFGLGLPERGAILKRHRLFESNRPLLPPRPCSCLGRPTVGVYGTGGAWKRKAPGGGGTKVVRGDAARALGIDWHSTQATLSQAVPPAYTEHLGRQLVDLP